METKRLSPETREEIFWAKHNGMGHEEYNRLIDENIRIFKIRYDNYLRKKSSRG